MARSAAAALTWEAEGSGGCGLGPATAGAGAVAEVVAWPATGRRLETGSAAGAAKGKGEPAGWVAAGWPKMEGVWGTLPNIEGVEGMLPKMPGDGAPATPGPPAKANRGGEGGGASVPVPGAPATKPGGERPPAPFPAAAGLLPPEPELVEGKGSDGRVPACPPPLLALEPAAGTPGAGTGAGGAAWGAPPSLGLFSPGSETSSKEPCGAGQRASMLFGMYNPSLVRRVESVPPPQARGSYQSRADATSSPARPSHLSLAV